MFLIWQLAVCTYFPVIFLQFGCELDVIGSNPCLFSILLPYIWSGILPFLADLCSYGVPFRCSSAHPCGSSISVGLTASALLIASVFHWDLRSSFMRTVFHSETKISFLMISLGMVVLSFPSSFPISIKAYFLTLSLSSVSLHN